MIYDGFAFYLAQKVRKRDIRRSRLSAYVSRT